MSVRKIKQSWWIDFRFEGVRHRKRSPDNSPAGAKAYESLLRQRLAQGRPIIEPIVAVPTFAAFAKDWYDTYVLANNRANERRNKESALRVHLLPRFGHLSLNAITIAAIERYKSDALTSGLSPKTVNNHLAVLRRCLHSANEWGVLDTVPKIRPIKAPPPSFDFLTLSEGVRLREAAREFLGPESGWYGAILCALRTGMRVGEVLALQWEDVDIERRQVTVRRALALGQIASPKNNRVRHIPLCDDLHLHLAERERTRGFVFATADGSSLNHKMASKTLDRICRKAGMRHIGWHVLRHTFASQLATLGIPVPAIQALLGHSTIQMTMRYAHLAPGTLRVAVDALLMGERREGQGDLGQPVGNLPAAIEANGNNVVERVR